MLDWDDLRFFLAVAQASTLSAAARTLKVTQPTVGRRLTAFEDRLGARLFVRTSQGFRPTPTGMRVLEHAQRMEAEALGAEGIATGRDRGLRGPVRITGSEWLVDRVLAPVIATLVVRHPGLEIELMGDPRHLNLARRDADIALRPSRFPHREVVQVEVAVIAFGLYASDSYLTVRGEPDFARQCEGHALVAMSASLAGIPDLAWLPRVASRARIAARANGRLPMATLAASGAGMALLPRLVGDGIPGLRHLPAPLPGPERQLWLAAHRDSRGTPRVKSTLDHLRQAIGRLRPLLRPR